MTCQEVPANPAPGAAVINLDSVAAVGARLTQLREAKNWSLDDVSARLKVSPQKLRALESGDLSLFPDRTFAAGIVRSYAKIMGADPAPFTAALRQANGPVEQNLSLPASSGAGLPARTRLRAAWQFAEAPVVVVGHCGCYRGCRCLGHVAYRRRFRGVARAPEGQRERDAGCGGHGYNRGFIGCNT